MTPDTIPTYAPRVLTQVPREWLQRLIARSEEFIAMSRTREKSDEAFDLGPNHTAVTPHVRRLRALVDRHPDFWAFASESPLADIAADLVGPDVKFHSSKLNYKWPGTGEIVKTPCPVPPDWRRQGYGSIFTSQRAMS